MTGTSGVDLPGSVLDSKIDQMAGQGCEVGE